MRVVDSERMGWIDRQAQEEFSIAQDILMEDAGLRAYLALKHDIWGNEVPPGLILFLVGKGNNGGDALVMARHCCLEGKRELAIVLAAGAPKPNTPPDRNLKICLKMGIKVYQADELPSGLIDSARWFLDGLFGTGLKGEARSPLKELFKRINDAPGRVVSIDVPSGIGDSFQEGFTCIQADYTLTIALPKICLYLPRARRHCGRILVVPGIFPRELVESTSIPGQILVAEDLGGLLPKLPGDVYKTRRGHLAVFAGAPGTSGAAWLCSTAASRSRTGLVTIHIDRQLYPACIPAYRSVMVRSWDETSSPDQFDLSRYTGLLIGPGWGSSEQRLRWLDFLLDSDLPGLLDADGLRLLGRLGPQNKRRIDMASKWVLTPHPGEFAALSGEPVSEVLRDPLPILKRVSSEYRAIVVLKGNCTWIAEPGGSFWILDGMNPAMATGGSGDVLAGIIAGFLAGGIGAPEAARAGVLLHDLIGKEALEERGYFIAEDLLTYISGHLGRLGKESS